MKNTTCLLLIAALTLPSSGHAFAAGAGGSETPLFLTGVLLVLILAILFFILVVPEETRERMAATMRKLRVLFIRGTEEREMEFDHDFDGIRELDNRIPPWFTLLFLGTAVFGAGYLLDYHVFGTSRLMAAEYQEEMAVAAIQRRIALANEGTIDEATLSPLTDSPAIGRGEEQYKKFCVSCHGMRGEGLVGPNLTDDYWIHGGGIKNVFSTIKMGVPAKGMISWQLVFTPKQIQEIGSYVLTLHGTNPPNGKKSEGDRYVEKAQTVAAADSARPAR